MFELNHRVYRRNQLILGAQLQDKLTNEENHSTRRW